MSTPYDPPRPEDRPSDQPGYPSAPPPQQYPQGDQSQGGYAGGPPQGGFPPAPGYGNDPQQQQYGNAPGFGNAPQYGDPYGGQQQAAATPPPTVVRAVQLMFVRVAVGVLSALIAFASGDAIKDSIRESNTSLTADEVDAAYALGVGVAVFFGLVFAVLYILLAIQVRKGKNWARIVTWVLAGLGVLSGLVGLLGSGTGLEKLVSVVLLLIDAAIIVFLALKPSSDYFASRKAPKY